MSLHRWLTSHEAQVAGDRAWAMRSMPKSACEAEDFWMPIKLPPRNLLWWLFQVLTHWPGLGCWHSDESVNAGKFLPQTCNSSVLLDTCLLYRLEPFALMETVSERNKHYVFCLLNLIHFCPLGFHRQWECEISVNSVESQLLWWIKLSLHDWVGSRKL